jgi:2-methylisocitrate lyase-like PEP mutase family enzyme
MLTTDHIPQALHYYEAGADFVYIPRVHSAQQVARILKQGLDNSFEAARAVEIEHLSHRREVLA